MLTNRAQVEYARSGVPLELISEPTKDLFAAIMEEGEPALRAKIAAAALAGGADPEPWNGVVHHGCALAAIASMSTQPDKREYRQHFRPIVTQLLKTSSDRSKEAALLTALRDPPTKWMIKDLRQSGAFLSNSACLKSIYYSCATDTKMLAQLQAARAIGWGPCGDAIEGELLCWMVKHLQPKSIFEFIDAYIQAGVELPDGARSGSVSPMKVAMAIIPRAASRTIDYAYDVIHAMATSGQLPGCDTTPSNGNWQQALADYRADDPCFLEDLEQWLVEGDQARIHRNTTAAPIKSRTGPRL
jgi:hypothetical protein